MIRPSRQKCGLLCGLLFPLILWAGMEGLAVKPLLFIPYDQTRIYFSDFFDTETILSKELAEKLQSIVFGFAPLPGKTLLYQSDYVRSKISLYFPEIDPLIQSDTVTVSRGNALIETPLSATTSSVPATKTSEDPPGALIDAEEWKSRLEEHARAFLTDMWMVAIPAEAFHLEIMTEPPTAFSEMPWEITYTRFGKSEFFVKIAAGSPVASRTTRWTGKVKPVWIRNLATAGRNIKYKETFLSDAVVYKPLNYFDYRDPVVEGVAFPKVSKAFIKSGTVIEGALIANPPYVRAGQVIFAVVIIGGVEVKGMVEVLKDAQIGEVIQARNVETGAILTGILEEGPVLRLY